MEKSMENGPCLNLYLEKSREAPWCDNCATIRVISLMTCGGVRISSRPFDLIFLVALTQHFVSYTSHCRGDGITNHILMKLHILHKYLGLNNMPLLNLLCIYWKYPSVMYTTQSVFARVN
jgi:hypothetical protein